MLCPHIWDCGAKRVKFFYHDELNQSFPPCIQTPHQSLLQNFTNNTLATIIALSGGGGGEGGGGDAGDSDAQVLSRTAAGVGVPRLSLFRTAVPFWGENT